MDVVMTKAADKLHAVDFNTK